MDDWVASVERARDLDASVGETFEKLVAEHIKADAPRATEMRYRYSIRVWNRVEQLLNGAAAVKAKHAVARVIFGTGISPRENPALKLQKLRIATQVAEQWLVTSEANRVAAAESMMRLGKDALTSLRSYDGPFMSQPRHLLQEFKYLLALSAVQSAVMSAGGIGGSAAGDKAWSAYKQAKMAAKDFGDDEHRSLIEYARRNALQAIDARQLEVAEGWLAEALDSSVRVSAVGKPKLRGQLLRLQAYVQHIRGAHEASVRFLDQANLEDPTAVGLLQRFAVLRAAERAGTAISANSATVERDGVDVSAADDGAAGVDSMSDRAPSGAVEASFAELCKSTLLDAAHIEDAIQLALEPPMLSGHCLLAAVQSLRARYDSARPVEVDICSFKVLRAVHRFDLADRLADELADGMHDSAAGGAVCTPAQRRLILHLWATASELLATHASTSTTAHPAPVDDSSSDNALKECHVWLKVLAKFPATLLESCEVSGALECNTAWCALHLGDLDEAAQLAAAVATSPSSTSAHRIRAEYIRACALLRSGNSKSAVSALAALGHVATATAADAELKRGLLMVAVQDAFECSDQPSAAEALLQFVVHDDSKNGDDEENNVNAGGNQMRGDVVHLRALLQLRSNLKSVGPQRIEEIRVDADIIRRAVELFEASAGVSSTQSDMPTGSHIEFESGDVLNNSTPTSDERSADLRWFCGTAWNLAIEVCRHGTAQLAAKLLGLLLRMRRIPGVEWKQTADHVATVHLTMAAAQIEIADDAQSSDSERVTAARVALDSIAECRSVMEASLSGADRVMARQLTMFEFKALAVLGDVEAMKAVIKRATAAPAASTLSAIDFAALAEIASESGPALRAITLECHAVASERALAAVGATKKTTSDGFIDAAQCSLDVDIVGPIVCNYAAALADAGDFARCARCVDRLVAALGVFATHATIAAGDSSGGPTTGRQLDPALAQRLAVMLFNRAVGLAQTPSPQHRADSLALSTAAMAVIKLVPAESSNAAGSLCKAITDGCAELAKFCA